MRLGRRCLASAAGAALLCMALLTFTGVMLPSWSSGRASGNDKDHGGTAGLLEIHVFVFNRPLAFERLWRSLSAAKPTQHLRTEVVIHQDYDPKEEADWRRQRALLLPLAGTASSHGHVRVAFGFAQRGLKATMFEAWSPQGPENFALFLEDDVVVSEYLFEYGERMIMAYKDSPASILGLKLYNQRWDESNMRASTLVANRFQPFLMQEPCSWGSVFFPAAYLRYQRWLASNANTEPLIPFSASNSWSAKTSAKKFLQRFMWEEHLFMISINFPSALSLTTNTAEPGENMKANAAWFMTMKARLGVPLLTTESRAKFTAFFAAPLPPITAMWVYNVSHARMQSMAAATPDTAMLAAFSNRSLLPPPELIDVPHKRGTWQFFVQKTASMLAVDLVAPRCAARKSLSLVEIAALMAILRDPLAYVSVPHYGARIQGRAVPPSIIAALEQAGSAALFAFARVLLGPQRALLVDVKFGLANRLRAYAHAKALAETSGRQLVVLWTPDSHCQAMLEELLMLPSSSIHVISLPQQHNVASLLARWPQTFDFYDTLATPWTETPIVAQNLHQIYIKSAHPLKGDSPTTAGVLIALRELFSRPVPQVQVYINKYLEKTFPNLSYTKAMALHMETAGVHIRSTTNPFDDTQYATELSAEERTEIEHFLDQAMVFRLSCHESHFIRRMQLTRNATHFFVSIDTAAGWALIQNTPELGGKVFSLRTLYPREFEACDRNTRQTACVQLAAADLVLLATSGVVLQSKWSSFSEVAVLVSRKTAVVGCIPPPEGQWMPLGSTPEATLRAQRRTFVNQYKDLLPPKLFVDLKTHGFTDTEIYTYIPAM